MKYFDRVKETATSTGTGDFTLAGAATGFRTFASVLSTSDTCYYCIALQGGSEWETGIGTYSAANTLTRTTVLASSNSGSAVNFSSGTKDVFLTVAAQQFGTAWADYTPTLTASVTNPTIGNGTILGRYKYLDSKTVALYVRFTFGSTSNAGSGTYSISLPSGITTPDNGLIQVLAGGIQDAGTDNKLINGKINPNSSLINEMTPEGGNVVTQATPMTWATNDTLYLSGVIEVA